MNNALTDLLSFERETQILAGIAGRLGWDQETVMPRGAAPLRAEESAAMEAILHQRRTDPRIADWLDASDLGSNDEATRAQLREIRRSFERNTKVPERLAIELARATSRAQGIWAEARENENFGAFAPTLEEVLNLRREEAAALSDKGDPYDALLQDYEPGASGAGLAEMFDAMRPRLVALAQAIGESGKSPVSLDGTFDVTAQMSLAAEISQVFGYDLSQGRIDKAVHPFSSGSGTDVRITTRTDPSEPFGCIYSTIHEVGHATYEQNVNQSYALSAIGMGASMGVHESQSRIYENQLGRSRAFCEFLYGKMRERFGDMGIANAQELYAAANCVSPGFIRTEADEVHYNLHIMLRFNLERALMSGALSVADLPGAWNEHFAADFGQVVDKPSNGVLQDVHWSVGLFGYFPTYSLGNVYAGCLFEKICAGNPTFDDDLRKGDLSKPLNWLKENVQQHGVLRTPRETIAHATGSDPDVEPLLTYLERKFAELYEL